MKMKSEHYNELKKAIEQVIAKHPNAKDEYQKQGLSMKRYRWDLFWATGLLTKSKDYYRYLNDEHIDTALRKITKTK